MSAWDGRRRDCRASVVLFAAVAATVVALVAGCGDGTADGGPPPTTIRLAPMTPDDPDRIAPEQHAAIAALAAHASSAAPPAGEGHHGHVHDPTAAAEVLDPVDEARFEVEWAAAGDAVPGLDTWAEATAAGYTRAAVQGAGVGVHWVNWQLIDRPFDPARPAMLLFDERDGRQDLVGYSYWLRSPAAPDGFAGDRDVWHRHTNLCVVNGWIDREMSESPGTCAGQHLGGADLWMLHAWVVPGRPNRWGDFATLHPTLCPSRIGTPDVMQCPTS